VVASLHGFEKEGGSSFSRIRTGQKKISDAPVYNHRMIRRVPVVMLLYKIIFFLEKTTKSDIYLKKVENLPKSRILATLLPQKYVVFTRKLWLLQ
ncbi:MAG TPA: hypothetical protein VK470_08050, partial [Bacteroidota bacterium]|nr:hypothetical protein [Bacteroidota bacterium]